MRNVLNALRIFEVIAKQEPVSLAAIASITEVPMTSAHRAVRTLAEAGWIESPQDGSRRWVVAAYARSVLVAQHHPLRAAADEICARLRDETGQSVSLSIPDGAQVVVIGHWEGTGMVRVVQVEGITAPLAMAATGKAYLAALSDDARKRVLAELPEDVDIHSLEHDIAIVRSSGFAVVDQEWWPGIVQIGVAIICDGIPLGGIGITLPAGGVDGDVTRELGEQLRLAAQTVAARLQLGKRTVTTSAGGTRAT
jgi:IclR family transcriptional regulator, acetate operon repressor